MKTLARTPIERVEHTPLTTECVGTYEVDEILGRLYVVDENELVADLRRQSKLMADQRATIEARGFDGHLFKAWRTQAPAD